MRNWPFKKGQSELKKLLSLFLPQDIGIVDIMPGLRIYLPAYERCGRIFWWFEEVEAALQFFMARYLPFNGRVIDVGAQSGLLGLWAARNKSCEVILLEADAEVQECIEKTLRLNPELQGLCGLIKAACSDSQDPRFPDQKAVRLDQLLEEKGWDHVDLIKIDTDGHEYEVIRSLGRRMTSDCVEALYIEMGGKEGPLFDLLKKGGFAAHGVRRTYLPELRKLGRNEAEVYWFYSVDSPVGEGSPFENFLWVAGGGTD